MKRNPAITLKALELARSFGFLYPRELLMLQALAWSIQRVEKPIIVNIGAGVGTSGMAFAEARPESMIFTCDISSGGPFGGMQNEINAWKLLEDQNIFYPRTTQLLGDSKELGKSWDRGQIIDLLFIDGDHSYAGCKGDQDAWLPWLKPGGIAVWHDYDNEPWGDVVKAVDELPWPVVLQIDTMISKRKPVTQILLKKGKE